MRAYSEEAPNQVELISPETYLVRWDIEKIVKEIEDKKVSQYTYEECIVPAPLTQDSILERAIRETISLSRELKLINDYNDYRFKLNIDSSVVDRYKGYLEWRKELKKKIDELCLYNDIQ